MTAVLLAALSGLSYGASDFSGALASKENDSTVVTVGVQVVSLAALAVIIVVFPPASYTGADLAWGALGGLGAGLGLTMFYRALAIGPMSTAASLTALVSALVPVVAGLALGENPAAITLFGVALAIPAAVLVSVGGVGFHGAAIDLPPRERVIVQQPASRTRMLSIVGGLGFGLFFVALSRTGEDAGLFPLIGARLASITALAVVLAVTGTWAPLSRRWWPTVAIAGLLDCAANSFYLIALREGSFVWVAPIASLYPVSTVLLARVVLKERLAPIQIVGLGLAGAALVFVALGA